MDVVSALESKRSDWYLSVDPETFQMITDAAEKFAVSRKHLFCKIIRFYTKSKHEKVNKLIESLAKANAEALQFANVDDSGTCNFDTPIIRLEGWSKSELFDLTVYSGVVGDKLDSRIFRNYRYVGTEKYGQAQKRTKMAEAACKSLKNDGYDVCMYYQAD